MNPFWCTGLDNNAAYLHNHCPQLVTPGFKDCLLITETFIDALILHTENPDCVQTIQCSSLDFSGFKALSEYHITPENISVFMSMRSRNSSEVAGWRALLPPNAQNSPEEGSRHFYYQDKEFYLCSHQ
ncbi:hypothetical protein BDB01DRAFT_836806 [Pilobolus umbonatus]|nr:hypothetical protein BDB01DRAFT_836806 [Pilobolus umbonatus]